MTPYGGDRVRIVGDTILLSCRTPKGWTGRVERSLNQSEFPGTAVLWDDAMYEVIKVEPIPAGVRYVLRAWEDGHAIRVSQRYDADSEAHRAAEHRAAIVHEHKRTSVNLFALFLGHLPAIVQERIGSENGVVAARLTFVSLFSQWAAIFACVAVIVIRVMRQEQAPAWAMILAGYLFIEAMFRFLINWTQSRPIGSSAGVIAYILYWLLTGARAATSPFGAPRGHAIAIPETPEDHKLADSMTMREPIATLLPVRDQQRLAERHGYDYRRSAYGVATILLVGSLLGIATSIRGGAIASLVTAIVIAVEQVVRLIALRSGPAPSVIGWIVRPLMRDLL